MELPSTPDAARPSPARAAGHCGSLFRDQRRLNRAFLCLRLDHATALPRVREYDASLSAECAGIQFRDVVLRGVETVEVKLRPLPTPAAAVEKSGR